MMRARLLVRVAAQIEMEHGPRVLEIELASQGGEDKPLQDLREVSHYMGSSGFINLVDVPWCPIFVGVIFMMHWLLGTIALLAALLFLAMGWLSDQFTRTSIEKSRASLKVQMDMAQQFRDSGDLVRAMGLVPNIVTRWSHLCAATTIANINSGDRSGVMGSAARFMRLLVQIIIMGVGMSLILKQELTPGVLIAASLVLSRALAPVEQSIGAVRSFNSARAAYNRLVKVLDRYEQRRPKLGLREPVGALSAEALSYTVEGRKAPVLSDVSFENKPGEVVAVVGPSGSGKSSLLRILAELQPASGGDVRLDGTKLSDWPEQQRGERVGYLPQDVDLMTGTIAENIAGFSNSQEAGKAVIEAAEAANLVGLIQHLPEGFNTIVGPYGRNLSGGQRQRIGLARALCGDRRIVLLDEPDSHLDQEGQQALTRTLATLKRKGCTVVFTTHRRSMLSSADKVMVLMDGRVTQFADTKAALSGKAGPQA
jgi:PrtD family type I secretion system ABC transporter